MTKILISTEVTGLHHLLFNRKELFDRYFEIFGMEFHTDTGIFIQEWIDTPDYHYYIKVDDNKMYDWDLDGSHFRTDPRIHKFFADEGLLDDKTRIVEIPDDIKWYIMSWEDGSESIEEHHRSWR
jgi:hypothetical protein